MVRIPILLVVILLGTACSSRSHNIRHTGRTIPLTDSILNAGTTDTIRFGRLGSGEIAVQRLLIRNDACHAVAITAYHTNCGCTSLEYDSQPIPPGESRQVELIFDSRGQWGWQLKSLEISFAGAKSPMRLLIEADIK